MQYELTEEQVMLRDMVRRLAREKVAPRAAEIDEKAEYPQDMFDLLRQNELLGIPLPQEYGGSGAGILSTCIVVEELAKYCYNTAYLVVLTIAPFGAILTAGSEEQKQRYLSGLATGELRAAIAVTEPEAGSDVAAIRTTAVLKDGHYHLNGTKCFITNATVADFMVVFAKTDPQKGARGISGFIVEKGSPGLTIGRVENKMGGRGLPSAEVFFDDCRIPQSSLLGRESEGFKTAMESFNKTRPVIGSRAVGLAQGALDYAVGYAKQRVAFGQPIAAFQGIQFMMADMAMQTEAARQLVYRAASLIDQGKTGREVMATVAMAKCFASDVAMRVAVDAAQILGGYGCLKSYPLERYIRDAKLLQVVEGTNQIQRLIIARSMLQ